jgi:nitrogen regulatory protein PII
MLKKVTAIFDELKLEEVESALFRHGVKGMTVHKVRGRGEYFNSYSRNKLTAHILVEVYTTEHIAEKVAKVIMDAAHSNMDDEGLVSIIPVDDFYWIHTKRKIEEAEFNFREAGHE